MLSSFIAVFFAVIKIVFSTAVDAEWDGRFFPNSDPALENREELKKYLHADDHGRIPMGISDDHCDWGEDPKGLDGDLGPASYTCLRNKKDFRPNSGVHPILRKDIIPKGYMPWHHCMNESITYNKKIPTYGDHRPLWPKYGEYSFLPKQRWLHSLEHGSIVMLYHPCADQNEVNILRRILKNCLYQYIITNFNQLESERPIVLVAWGVTLEISRVDPKIVVDFIRENAHQAPEKVYQDGQYTKNLLEPASEQLEGEENNICPND